MIEQCFNYLNNTVSPSKMRKSGKEKDSPKGNR